MAFGPFSSESNASQTTQTVSDQGQLLNKKNKVAQGQGVLIDYGKSKLENVGNTLWDLSGATVYAGGSMDGDSLNSLLSSTITSFGQITQQALAGSTGADPVESPADENKVVAWVKAHAKEIGYVVGAFVVFWLLKKLLTRKAQA